MGRIPQDATRRSETGRSGQRDDCEPVRPHGLPDGGFETTPRLMALQLRLRRAARAYFDLTGAHLPICRQIAQVHAALHCDVPFSLGGQSCTASGVEILCLPPDAQDTAVLVDLSKPFATLIVVRIHEDFSCEARMIPRRALPPAAEGRHRVPWESLPHRF